MKTMEEFTAACAAMAASYGVKPEQMGNLIAASEKLFDQMKVGEGISFEDAARLAYNKLAEAFEEELPSYYKLRQFRNGRHR